MCSAFTVLALTVAIDPVKFKLELLNRRCCLYSTTGLANMGRLQKLVLTSNHITELHDLTGLPALQHLLLQGNFLCTLQDISLNMLVSTLSVHCSSTSITCNRAAQVFSKHCLPERLRVQSKHKQGSPVLHCVARLGVTMNSITQCCDCVLQHDSGGQNATSTIMLHAGTATSVAKPIFPKLR